MQEISKEFISRAGVEYIKKQKNTEKSDIAIVERQIDGCVIRGTCPIDLEGHNWTEEFSVTVDLKGKIQAVNCALL
jgi:hypothetical protein